MPNRKSVYLIRRSFLKRIHVIRPTLSMNQWRLRVSGERAVAVTRERHSRRHLGCHSSLPKLGEFRHVPRSQRTRTGRVVVRGEDGSRQPPPDSTIIALYDESVVGKSARRRIFLFKKFKTWRPRLDTSAVARGGGYRV